MTRSAGHIWNLPWWRPTRSVQLSRVRSPSQGRSRRTLYKAMQGWQAQLSSHLSDDCAGCSGCSVGFSVGVGQPEFRQAEASFRPIRSPLCEGITGRFTHQPAVIISGIEPLESAQAINCRMTARFIQPPALASAASLAHNQDHHSHDPDHSHSHDHGAQEHGHTHELMEHPGQFDR